MSETHRTGVEIKPLGECSIGDEFVYSGCHYRLKAVERFREPGVPGWRIRLRVTRLVRPRRGTWTTERMGGSALFSFHRRPTHPAVIRWREENAK